MTYEWWTVEAISNGFYSAKNQKSQDSNQNFSHRGYSRWILLNLPQVSSDMTFSSSTAEATTKLPGKETRLSTHIDRILSYTSFPGFKINKKIIQNKWTNCKTQNVDTKVPSPTYTGISWNKALQNTNIVLPSSEAALLSLNLALCTL